ncbi:putative polysaccharide biosynthesis protein [Selenomonas ruminantium subsp. lactilytica TAM6421]|uniref:Putative polysaccharide biosynthesis protein n=1 Tax=Selenomonas ruminantium subsp. lactilytica (strain NBRC 103574 / TAM6421) TaxID=927704 RepID=I0GUG5_SELRL|nr:nucleoside-diphosphate sugar epimerase/dehydratase [Selenomonas ruminantium]BAL84402.1 putative polysaccharide biosynthesis protein [Selenomonas ruminantium subsp. lactilytica TAM6421]
MNYLEKIRDKLKLILIDAIILSVVPIFALLLRFEGSIPATEYVTFRNCLPWMVIISLAIFYFYGMYHRIWHYARMRDLVAIVGAVTLSQTAVFIITTVADIPVPRSVIILTWLLSICTIGASRLMFKVNLDLVTESKGDKENLLIVGAGDAGAMLVRELEQNANATTNIIGFVDDDEKKRKGRLAGFPVLGNINELPQVVKANNIDEIVIAIPSADGDTIRHIDNLCRKTGSKVRIMPGIYEMVSDEMNAGEMREIRLEDLLRRDPIHLDFGKITNYIAGKTVLITGAGGSIGSEISRQISRVGAKEIILLGRGENSIYEIHQELKRKFPEQTYHTVIANITDRERMARIFKRFQPQVVFHAAAHKHVPLMEIQPEEAIRNNVFGTKNVAELSDQNQAEIFVLISTDKAVNPTSVMGATKRAAELVLQEINQHSQTKFVTVRFGNVLGSRGSVVPLFERQIANGGPITVTHKDMTRFFMLIPEAVQLVLQAGSQAEGGEVFLFDMGKPVKIKDMAEDLIRLHGLTPDKDIKIVYTGLRPGEKLYEELLTSEEGTTSTKHKKIFKAHIQPLDEADLKQSLQTLQETTDRQIILQTLKHMIPTYKSKQLEEGID